MYIFQYIGKIFIVEYIFVEFQRVALKFNTRYISHTMRDAIFM